MVLRLCLLTICGFLKFRFVSAKMTQICALSSSCEALAGFIHVPCAVPAFQKANLQFPTKGRFALYDLASQRPKKLMFGEKETIITNRTLFVQDLV